jgi:hypothetical protein
MRSATPSPTPVTSSRNRIEPLGSATRGLWSILEILFDVPPPLMSRVSLHAEQLAHRGPREALAAKVAHGQLHGRVECALGFDQGLDPRRCTSRRAASTARRRRSRASLTSSTAASVGLCRRSWGKSGGNGVSEARRRRLETHSDLTFYVVKPPLEGLSSQPSVVGRRRSTGASSDTSPSPCQTSPPTVAW